MSFASPLSPTVAADLVRAVDVHRAVIPARFLPLVRELCLESAGIGLELGGRDVALRAGRAGSAAALLLELICPWLDAATREDLMIVCWEAAAGAA